MLNWLSRFFSLVDKYPRAQYLVLLLPFFAIAFQYIKLFTVGPGTLNILEAVPNTYLSSNSTAAGAAAGTLLTALTPSGFQTGASSIVNTNTNSYIAWNWKESPTAGFDIVSYTGTGASTTVAHSLGATPTMIIVKRLDAVSDWPVYHDGLGNATNTLRLNTTAIAAASSSVWRATPTAAVFNIGSSPNVNSAGGSYLAYLFTDISGFSKMGSYTGNGAADGAFVYTGFKPKYIMIKRTTTTVDDWHIFDTERSTFNPTATVLLANTTAADTALAAGMDINSNGFKLRSTDAGINASGATYVYAAFAEYPFKEQFTPNGYSIASSTRFNGVNGNLTRTPPAGDQQKWTYSAWFKPSDISKSVMLLHTGSAGSTASGISTSDTDKKLSMYQLTNSTTYLFNTCVVGALRDPSKWYHVVVAVDTTQATAADRIKMYVDGDLKTRVTAPTCGGSGTGSTTKDPAQNANLRINSAILHKIGTNGSTIDTDGYFSDVYFLEGAVLGPTSFGAFDSNGIWRPIAYTGSYIADSVKYLSAFLSNGFTLFTNSLVNSSGDSYIAWNWKESPTAGFDIVSYTGTGASTTVAHSLGATPTMIIVKRLDAVSDWPVYHDGLGNATNTLRLNATAIAAASSSVWRATPTPAVFSIGSSPNVNSNGGSYLAYLFTDISGYSKFGSYTGNGAADGAFVYTGFKPKYIMIKRTTTTVDDWHIFDTERETYNPTATVLLANTTAADTALAAGMDINSNGFKLRTTNAGVNASGATYVYAAFAEYPFKEQFTPNGYSIASSTRFNGTNAALNKTFASTGNRQTWTWSGWVKRSDLTTRQGMFTVGPIANGGNELTTVEFTATDALRFAGHGISTATYGNKITTELFRDTSRFYHVVAVYDTTNSTAADRMRLYVDGERITNFSTSADPVQNVLGMVNTTQQHGVGYLPNFTATPMYYNGYISDTYFIDGAALDPTSFGAFDSNGIWRPKSYSGTYGTNGFHLDFASSTNPGLDTSGNGNNFTNNNIATTDNVIDSPTNNFSTLSAIDKNAGVSLSNGNQQSQGTATWQLVHSTHSIPDTGKYYWEVRLVSGNANSFIGVRKEDSGVTGAYPNVSYSYYGFASQIFSSSNILCTGVPALAANDVVQFAFDADNDKLYVGRNNVFYSSTCAATGNPTTGVNPTATSTFGTWFPFSQHAAAATGIHYYSFGQNGDTGLTYDSASGGYFKYTPPTGFKALSTANLPSSTIAKGDNYFDIASYTGTGASLSITSLNFQPDLLWIKDRTTANSHAILDSLTSLFSGAYCVLSSDSTAARTCGTSGNSFHLDFASSTNPGLDVSGSGNNFTNNNIATTDNVIDTPTNNFATHNVLWTGNQTNSAGNLTVTSGSADDVFSNFEMKSGKWYWETYVNALTLGGSTFGVGIIDDTYKLNTFTWTLSQHYAYRTGSLKAGNGTTAAYGTAIAAGDIIGTAFDADNGTIEFYRNGVSQGVAFTGIDMSKSWRGFINTPSAAGTAAWTSNYGQGGTTTLAYDSASGGYFKYTPPSGFKALSTANLPSGTITKGDNYFDAVTYTGNGTSQSVSSLNFEAGLLWIKDRTSVNSHAIFANLTASVATVMQWFEF